ncbi:hypothetical protein [Sphingorhabdus sp. M41]|uniref:hypothetical protein n=1 Tax=Sphingorhabdus sp. M41 TaxID=1806885 RepID=UPI00078BDFBF|nr:hypothetical protein [Sphingorhabdus sp. M41]AMO71657.1 hypothetical protein AZE99_07145 [Sphingorhabdus sp. M41]
MNNDWQSVFAQDASLFPHLADLAKDQVLLSTMSEAAFRQASFLDQRILTPELQRQIVSWPDIPSLPPSSLNKPHYIFHVGHVGSTLISRLLGELDDFLALREPAILRQLAEVQVVKPADIGWSEQELATRLTQVENWLSRVFHANQRVMIKASSFVSPLAKNLLADNGTALFLFASLDRYLPTILAGDASKQEAAALAELRLLRLERHCGESLASKETLSLAQTAALGWLCEMVTLCDAEHHCPDANIAWMDFDDFLHQPAEQLQIAASHFGRHLSMEDSRSLVSSPIMTSYSKAPEYDYSASLREELLAEAAQIHADDIRQTLLWVNQLARRFPVVGAAIAKAETRR